MSQITDHTRNAVIVAHGSPADPAPQETVLLALAEAVSRHLPGWTVRSATLAAEGALERALRGLAQPRIYPFFMSNGWFAGTALPRSLAAAGVGDAVQLAPFGTDPGLVDLVSRAASAAARSVGIAHGNATLLLASHGSGRSRQSADSTWTMVERLSASSGFGRVLCGFVEQAPFLSDAARVAGSGLCLPFFALRAGHVLTDIPAALSEAGFQGPILPPIGEHPDVPALVAAALLRSAPIPGRTG